MSKAGSYRGGINFPDELESLTGNVGGPVGADENNNIDIVGTDPILVTGDPPNNILTITVEDATEVQIGVMRFATDAETIDGTIDNAAVHPVGLKAKLGDQTVNALAYGNGDNQPIEWLAPGDTGEVLLGSTGNPPLWSDPAEDGEVLIGVTGADPVWSTLTAGAGIAINSTPGQITITNTGGGTGGGGIEQIVMDIGNVQDPGTGIIQLLGGANITTAGIGDTGTVTLNDNVTILGTFRSLNGDFNLPSTNAGLARGTIQWGSVPVIHTFGTDNYFFGVGAGNGTLSLAMNNVGIGSNALTSLTTGSQNLALGDSAGDALAAGSDNVIAGYNAGSTLAGDDNTILGSEAAVFLGDGDCNIIIGSDAGVLYSSTESSNIIIGNSGETGDNNVMRLGTDGTNQCEVDETYIAGIYQRLPSSTSELTLTDADGEMTTIGTTANNGEVLIGSTGSIPAWNTISAGTGINITNGPNSITITNTGSTLQSTGTWTPVFSWANQTVPPNYVINLARYTKTGEIVQIFMDAYFGISAGGVVDIGSTTDDSDLLVMSGLPFSTGGTRYPMLGHLQSVTTQPPPTDFGGYAAGTVTWLVTNTSANLIAARGSSSLLGFGGTQEALTRYKGMQAIGFIHFYISGFYRSP